MNNNIASYNYPISEPTSALTFNDLVIEVAYKLNIASYGATGTGILAPPTDAHDLALCQRIVNNGIRMFLNDGPSPNGWKFSKPIAQVDMWPTIAADAVISTTSWITLTGFRTDSLGNSTTLLHLNYASTVVPSTIGAASTNGVPLFFPSMEMRPIYLGGNPPPGAPGQVPPTVLQPANSTTGTVFTIMTYFGPNDIEVWGVASTSALSTGSCVWSMPTQGDYTLPANFGGSFAGPITFISNTNRGMVLTWTDESAIRMRRQNYNFESGTPYECAVRLMPTPSIMLSTYAPMRRRWELMTWRISNEFLHVLFPYVLGFDNLVNTTDVPPAPFMFDEAVKAACLAQAEKQAEDTVAGPDWTYYKTMALQNAYRLDAMSAPKKMGYWSNPGARGATWGMLINGFRELDYQRPTVGVQSRPI